MTKAELIEKAAGRAKTTKKCLASCFDAALDVITAALKKGERVPLVGFGTFDVRTRKAREGRNPQTGAKIRIPGRKVPVFKAGKALKNAVK